MIMKALKIPKTPGLAIDALHKLRVKRKALQAQAEVLKDDETKLEDAIFGKFKNADLEGARGKLAQASISRSDVPTIKDWDAFAAHVLETKSLDLLQRRVVVEAWRERLAAGTAVPGIDVFTKVRLNLTAVKRGGSVKPAKKRR